jgi:fatty acid CoA ligase FadD9
MELTRDDARLAATLPDPAVNEAKTRPGLDLAQIMAICMEGYADRPALAQRATELVTDRATGRRSGRLLRHFETISYRDLWSRARAIASVWCGDDARPVRANDPTCILVLIATESWPGKGRYFHREVALTHFCCC